MKGDGVDLGRLIDLHRGARSYAELARDCGGSPSSKRLQQLVTQPIKNFPDPDTIKALARGLRLSHTAVVLAAAESLGLDTARGDARVVELMPPRARDLSEEQAGAIAHLVHTIVETTSERGDADVDRDAPAIADVATLPSPKVDLTKPAGGLAPVIDLFHHQLEIELAAEVKRHGDWPPKSGEAVREIVQNATDAILTINFDQLIEQASREAQQAGGQSLREDYAARETTK